MDRDRLARLLCESISGSTEGYVRTDADYELMGQMFVEGFIDLRAVADDVLRAVGGLDGS